MVWYEYDGGFVIVCDMTGVLLWMRLVEEFRDRGIRVRIFWFAFGARLLRLPSKEVCQGCEAFDQPGSRSAVCVNPTHRMVVGMVP